MSRGLGFFKQKTAYEICACLVGSEMCIRDSISDAIRITSHITIKKIIFTLSLIHI
ncbi:hypothetical protein JMUB7529_28360 [Staphylococcus aureus]